MTLSASASERGASAGAAPGPRTDCVSGTLEAMAVKDAKKDGHAGEEGRARVCCRCLLLEFDMSAPSTAGFCLFSFLCMRT